MIAFENGHLGLVKTLIEAGADQSDKVGQYTCTMLFYSIHISALYSYYL